MSDRQLAGLIIGVIFLVLLPIFLFLRRPKRPTSPTSNHTETQPDWTGIVKGIALALEIRPGAVDEYRSRTRTPAELRIEIKKIDREFARRSKDDQDEWGFAHVKRFLGGVASKHELTLFTQEELHQARDLFEEQLAASAPALVQGTQEQDIEEEITRKYEEELAHGFRERVALDKARDNLKARYPSHAKLIDRLHRKKADKLADPHL